MNREIKFRAWDKFEKKMKYNQEYIFTLLSDNDGTCVYMQYTGLKDKNNEEIYEGDIVKGQGSNLYEIKYLNELYWDGGGSVHPGFWLIDKYDKDKKGVDMDYHVSFIGCEVIGNTYENPELLK